MVSHPETSVEPVNICTVPLAVLYCYITCVCNVATFNCSYGTKVFLLDLKFWLCEHHTNCKGKIFLLDILDLHI